MIESLFQPANDNNCHTEVRELSYIVISLPNCCDLIFPDDWHSESIHGLMFGLASPSEWLANR